MTNKEFENIVTEQFKLCEDLLIVKSNEYSFNNEDRLQAFKDGAILNENSPSETLLGYLTKHIVSIYNMIKSNRTYSIEKYNEKLTDIINYCVLLKALIVEESEANNE